MKRYLLISIVAFSTAAVVAVSRAQIPASQQRTAEPIAHRVMTQEIYAEYLRRFNAGDDRYAELYDDNVVFDHGQFYGVLRGRQAIVDFYRDIRTQMKESVTATAVVIDNDQRMMAAELSTELRAIRDGVKLASRTLNTGDVYTTRGTVLYKFSPQGKITFIRGAVQGASFEPAKK